MVVERGRRGRRGGGKRSDGRGWATSVWENKISQEDEVTGQTNESARSGKDGRAKGRGTRIRGWGRNDKDDRQK